MSIADNIKRLRELYDLSQKDSSPFSRTKVKARMIAEKLSSHAGFLCFRQS